MSLISDNIIPLMFPVNIKKHIDDTTVPVVGEALLSQVFLHRINELATKPHLGITFQIHLLNLVWELESKNVRLRFCL